MEYVIEVMHKGEWKMVGKLFEQGGQHYFLHQEHAPTQQHYSTHAPGGIDVDVIWQLRQWEPVIGRCLVIHRNSRGSRALYADQFESLGSRQNWDSRDRYFVDVGFWQDIFFPHNPWVNAHHKIERPRASKWVPIEAPKPPEPNPQGQLF